HRERLGRPMELLERLDETLLRAYITGRSGEGSPCEALRLLESVLSNERPRARRQLVRWPSWIGPCRWQERSGFLRSPRKIQPFRKLVLNEGKVGSKSHRFAKRLHCISEAPLRHPHIA